MKKNKQKTYHKKNGINRQRITSSDTVNYKPKNKQIIQIYKQINKQINIIGSKNQANKHIIARVNKYINK